MSPNRRTPRSVIHLSAVPPGAPTRPTIHHPAERHRPEPRLTTTSHATLPPNTPGAPTEERRPRPAAVPPSPAPDTDGGPFGGPSYAHDHRESPLDRWCWRCTCPSCQEALRGTAIVRPRLALVVRSAFDRVVVTAQQATWAWARDGTVDRLVDVDCHTIHEVHVAAGAPDVAPADDQGSRVESDAGDRRVCHRLADVVPPHRPEPAA